MTCSSVFAGKRRLTANVCCCCGVGLSPGDAPTWRAARTARPPSPAALPIGSRPSARALQHFGCSTWLPSGSWPPWRAIVGSAPRCARASEDLGRSARCAWSSRARTRPPAAR
eukprot:7389829-Prymnesium_polylepis.1